MASSSCGRCSSQAQCSSESGAMLGNNMLSKDDVAALRILNAATDGDIPGLRKLVAQLRRSGKGIEEALAAVKDTRYTSRGPLHMAAWAGRVEMCKFLIKDLHMDVDTAGKDGATPLLYSLYGCGSTAIVRLLLDRGANPNKADNKGFTPLHTAASNQGTHPGSTSEKTTKLWAATTRDNYEIAELLLSRGAYVDPICEKGTPLHLAAQYRNVRVLELLLQHQANPNRVARLFYTPLASAILASSLKCVELLIKAGADVNAGRPVTPLVTAATYGSTDCMKCLLDAGADPNIPDEIGRMPLEIAATQGRKECVKILFPLTTPVARFTDWSIDGIIQHAKYLSSKDPLIHGNDRSGLKAQGDAAFHEKDYSNASALYTKAMETDHDDSTLYAKRSLCWLHMSEKDKALDDANTYKDKELDLTNSCYEQAAALILTKDYGQACKALMAGLKLDFGSDSTGEASRGGHR